MSKTYIKKNGIYCDADEIYVKQSGSYRYGTNNVQNTNIKTGGAYTRIDTQQTSISPMAVSVQPAAIYGLRKINPSYSGNCCQVRDSGNTLRTVTFDSNGNVDQAQFAAWGDGVTFTVSLWYDQSGNARNLSATSRPRLLLSAYTDALGNPRPTIDFPTKGMSLNGSYTGFTVDQTSSFSAFVIGNVLGHSGSGTQPRPGTYTIECPALSIGTSSGIFFLNSEPKSAEGVTSNLTNTFRNVIDSALGNSALTGTGTARYRNVWYNLKKGGLLSGGSDSRICFENRIYNLSSVSGYLTVGANAARTQTFNGHISEVIIYNDPTNSLTDRECLGIALSQRAYWGSIPASNYSRDSDPYKASTVLPIAAGGWTLAGDGIFPPIQKYTPGGGENYEVSDVIAKSPPYPITKMRWAFSNWWTINDGSEPPEADNTNNIVIMANVFADGVLLGPLTFNGQTEVTLTPGTDIFCDDFTVSSWNAKDYTIRTYVRYTGTRPCSTRIGTRGVQARTCANSTEAISLLASGTIVSNMNGNGRYVFGPSFGISDGWDGRPCPLIFGDSIAFGNYDATSWITKGLSSVYGGQDLPFLNMAVQGTRPGNSYNIDPGIFRRKDQLIRYAIAINKGRALWTSIIHEGGVNDAGSGTTASLQSKVYNLLKFVKYRYNPQKLVQTTYTPRNNPADVNWLHSYPDTPECTTASATSDRWQVGDWIKTTPWPLTGYIDVREDWTGSVSGTKWIDNGGVGALQSGVSIGATSFISNAPAPIGGIAVLDAGTAANIEAIIQVTNSVDNGNGTYTITTRDPATKVHASGAVVRYASSADGIHPIPNCPAFEHAAQRVCAAKIANMF